jgi:hypothetical protein
MSYPTGGDAATLDNIEYHFINFFGAIIMHKSKVIPRSNLDLVNWVNQFATMPSGHCGITEDDLAGFRTAADDYRAKMTAADIAQTAAKQANVEKLSSRQVLEGQIRPLARRIKAHPDYTKALGVQLGIEGSSSTYDLRNAVPDLTVGDKTGGTVELRFSRHGSDGVNIYFQREQDSEWNVVGRAMTSPFLDIRPLQTPGKPEIRRYTAVYMQKDNEIGRYSDDVIVTCIP